MRHPHDHTVYARGAGLVDDGFESRDQHLAALQTKTFLRRPLPGQEVLEPGQENKRGRVIFTATGEVNWKKLHCEMTQFAP